MKDSGSISRNGIYSSHSRTNFRLQRIIGHSSQVLLIEQYE